MGMSLNRISRISKEVIATNDRIDGRAGAPDHRFCAYER